MIRLFVEGFIDELGFSPTNRPDSSRSDSLSANDIKGVNDQKVPEVNSDMSTAIGQSLTHEKIKSKKIQLWPNKGLGGFDCCNFRNDSKLAESLKMNKFCKCVVIKAGDKCYGNKVLGLNFIKTFKTLENCKLEIAPLPRNFHSVFLDSELFYNKAALEHLEKNGGIFQVDNFDLMREIIVSYDDRSMQLPVLFLIQINHYKLHNILVAEMKRVKGFMSNSAIAFEVRKLVVAIAQKTYIDYLRTILRKF